MTTPRPPSEITIQLGDLSTLTWLHSDVDDSGVPGDQGPMLAIRPTRANFTQSLGCGLDLLVCMQMCYYATLAVACGNPFTAPNFESMMHTYLANGVIWDEGVYLDKRHIPSAQTRLLSSQVHMDAHHRVFTDPGSPSGGMTLQTLQRVPLNARAAQLLTCETIIRDAVVKLHESELVRIIISITNIVMDKDCMHELGVFFTAVRSHIGKATPTPVHVQVIIKGTAGQEVQLRLNGHWISHIEGVAWRDNRDIVRHRVSFPGGVPDAVKIFDRLHAVFEIEEDEEVEVST